jgi:acyl phosphate:glycerol-3-phosphate acyltransferase
MTGAALSSTAVTLAVTIACGYLIGSIPTSRLLTGRDLRDIGDRNPGYWNARETVGHRAAAPVFVADCAKGAIAAAIGLLGTDWWVSYVGIAAAMIGHAWPVFAHFRGGRSVLAWVGGFVVVAPLAAAIAVGVLVAVRLVWPRVQPTRHTEAFRRAAQAGIIAAPIAQIAVDGPYRTAATGCLMSLFGLRFLQAWRR